MGRGLLIDIEGIDASGGETHTGKLRDFLKSMKLNPMVFSYPDYNSAFGEKIRDFLDKKLELTPEEQFAVYSSDMLKDEHLKRSGIERGRVIIRNRGPNTTCAYQSAAGYDFESAVKYQKKVQLLADLVILIDIPPEESLRRKKGDSEELDRFESDMKYLAKVRENFHNLCGNKLLGKDYVIVNGSRPIEEVQNEIREKVLEKIRAA